MEEKLYNNQSQAWDKTKDVGGLGNNWSNNQIFWGNGRAQPGGGHKLEIHRTNMDRRSENKQQFANTGEYKYLYNQQWEGDWGR